MSPDTLLKAATVFEVMASKNPIKDLNKSMKGCLSVLKEHLPHISEMKNVNEIKQKHLEEIRDFTGNLALLCNMILNGKEYSEKEMQEAIKDM